jgi:hypothetical protein
VICQPCDGTGLRNVDQLTQTERFALDEIGPEEFVARGLIPDGSDVQVCNCCGNGRDAWHGTPGEHYGTADPPGPYGPYAYNGGLCECH